MPITTRSKSICFYNESSDWLNMSNVSFSSNHNAAYKKVSANNPGVLMRSAHTFLNKARSKIEVPPANHIFPKITFMTKYIPRFLNEYDKVQLKQLI